jgi:hypothetical protein
MTDYIPKHIASSTKRFDHLLVELLSNNDGIFVGEDHTAPAIRQSIAKLLPLLKAQGVGTLSIEVSQERIDAITKAGSYAECLAAPLIPRNINANEGLYNLVKEARKLDLQVLGHDNLPFGSKTVDEVARWVASPEGMKARDRPAAKFIGVPKRGRSSKPVDDVDRRIGERLRWAASPEGMKARDQSAAEFISSRKCGKVLVLGGLAHSGRHSKTDAESVGMDDFYFNDPTPS